MLNGCAFLGLAAQALPVADIQPAYSGLNGQTVAIYVDADDAQRMDYPTIEGDIASAIKNHLKESKDKELDRTNIMDPYSVVQFQREHPELKAMPITEFAPRLGVTRVVYIELRDFSTQSNVAIELYRGSALANVRVVEVTPRKSGSAKVAFKEDDIRVQYPKQGGEGQNEGAPAGPDINASDVYLGTVQQLALEISERFYQHAAPDDDE
jgi:hypothetical protein